MACSLTEFIREDEFFDGDGLNRIQIQCNVKNAASAGVARRNGYVLEGTIRQRRFNPVLKEYADGYLFSKLRSEWQKSKESA